MSFTHCPAEVVQAPLEVVWSLVGYPSAYARWWPARLDPGGEGLARPGQVITARPWAMGIRWLMRMTIEMINPERHQIRLRVPLPFGIVEYTHITCSALSDTTCRVQYG